MSHGHLSGDLTSPITIWEWSDHNLVLSGELGSSFHDVYDYIEQFSPDANSSKPGFHLSRLHAGDAQIWLTVPKQRRDIRRALLAVILDADEEVYIRSWYFIPDREILNALRSQAAAGVRVRVLLSDKTRMPIIDAANPIHAHKLTASGGEVYRYKGKYMHAKAAWNNRGDVVFGSANMDWKALKGNFECSIAIRDVDLANELTKAFEADLAHSSLHRHEVFANRSLISKAAAHMCKHPHLPGL